MKYAIIDMEKLRKRGLDSAEVLEAISQTEVPAKTNKDLLDLFCPYNIELKNERFDTLFTTYLTYYLETCPGAPRLSASIQWFNKERNL